MIGKASPVGAGFKGIINYLMLGKKAEPNPDRVDWVETRNLAVDDPDLALRVMRATAAQADKCKKPVYHFAISWTKEEAPTPEMMRQVAHQTIKDLNLDAHQAILIAHKDTDHRHVHIVANRVVEREEGYRTWKNSHDYRTIELSLAKQARELGMEVVPGRHNSPERFKDVPKRARNSERRMAERTGTLEKLKGRWTPEQIASRRPDLQQVFAHARSWADLDRTLAMMGMKLERKGQGLVLTDGAATMKLSDIGKQVRMKGLEDRFHEPFRAFDARRKEEQRLQELSRDERMAILAQHRDRVKPAATTTTSEDAAPPATATVPTKTSPKREERDRQQGKKNEAYKELQKSNDATDLAFKLHAAGLARDADLKRALDEKKRAEEAVHAQRDFSQKLERDIAKSPALNRAKARADTSQEKRSAKARKPARRDKGRDRDR